MNLSTSRFVSFTPGFDRADHRRNDPAWLAEQLAGPAARIVPLWRGRGLLRTRPEPAAVFLPARGFPLPERWVFLGVRLADGVPFFAVDLSAHPTAEAALAAAGLDDQAAGAGGDDTPRFVEMRFSGGLLPLVEGGIITHARALLEWHRREKFCRQCGAALWVESGGHVLACRNPDCRTNHFPRTDPAVIAVVSDGERCLLGRQPSWPPGFYSALAGFVEPGESLEEAVVREVREESGIEVAEVDYFGSQPWPYPQSLMLGFFARARSTEIRRGEELEDVRWFSREETGQLLAGIATARPHHNAIARYLIQTWYDGGVRV